MRETKVLIYGCVLSLVFFTGCSGSGGDRKIILPQEPVQLQDAELPPLAPPPAAVSREPWELWPPNRTLQGEPIEDAEILDGDALYARGQIQEALNRYYRAREKSQSQEVIEALVMRCASLELSLGDHERALKTLSEYFRKSGKGVGGASARFALIFAFAYGRDRNYDQSFAWFSRAQQLAARLKNAASEGVEALLQNLPQSEFIDLPPRWSSDLFISERIAKELGRRNIQGADAGSNYFSENSTDTTPAAPDPDFPHMTIAALLPFSGKFSPLGASTRNGIDLALSGQGLRGNVEVLYRDDAGSTAEARARAEEIASTPSLPVVLGPMIAESTLAAQAIFRDRGLAQIALSKTRELRTGEGIYRLAATIESQVEALLGAAQNHFNLSRSAIVAPDDATGKEFSEVFRAAAERRGILVSAEIFYLPGSSAADITGLEVLENKNIQALFFPDTLRAALDFINILPPGLRGVRLLGTAQWDDPVQLEHSKTALDGALFPSLFFTKSPRPLVAEFVTAYRNEYGQTPDFFAAQGFDLGTMVASALRRQVRNGIGFRSALEGIQKYQGLTGTISVLHDGELGRVLQVVHVDSGEFEEINPEEIPVLRKSGEFPAVGAGDPVRTQVHDIITNKGSA